MTQQTEASSIPPDHHWIAVVPNREGSVDFIVFGGRVYDATYKTEAEARTRIDYIKRGGDGW